MGAVQIQASFGVLSLKTSMAWKSLHFSSFFFCLLKFFLRLDFACMHSWMSPYISSSSSMLARYLEVQFGQLVIIIFVFFFISFIFGDGRGMGKGTEGRRG